MSLERDYFEDKVILITGASSGIGEAAALEFARLGAKVAVTGRNQSKLDAVISRMISESAYERTTSGKFLAIQADFEKSEQLEGLLPQTIAHFGRLDVLINNAGFSADKLGLFDEGFFKDFERLIQVNLVAPSRLAYLSVGELTKSKGVIINVSSVADQVPLPSTGYSVAKAGLSMLSKCLANSLGSFGVRVVTLAPGPVKTNISPNLEQIGKIMCSLGRSGTVEEVAQALVYLSSPRASFVHGSTLYIDGGAGAYFGGLFSRMDEKLAAE